MKKILLLLTIVFITLSGQTCGLFNRNVGGVYRSVDGGKTWQSIDELKIKGEKTDNPPAAVFSLTVDPSNPDIIYAGTKDRGIYKTENRGRTWKRINQGINLTGDNPTIYTIAVDPKNSNNIYSCGVTDNYGKIFKSTNGGGEWREVFSESRKSEPVTTLTIVSSRSKIIIAGSASGGVFASLDSGETWQHVGWFEDRVVSVGVKNSNYNILYVATKTNGAFRSDNFGKKWAPITKQVGLNKEPTSKSNRVNIGKMAVSPINGNVLYLSTRAGIYRSGNGGRSWSLLPTLLPPEDALLATDIKVSNRNSDTIYFAVPGVVYKAENSGHRWISTQLSVSGKINILAIDSKNPNVIYAGAGK